VNSDCTHWQGSIAAYVDGELPADARQAFRLHAQSCAACAMQALAAAEAKLAIRSAGQRYSAPPELRSRVAQLIAGGGAPRMTIAAQADDSVFQPQRKLIRWPQWAMAAAALLIIAVGSFMAVNQQQQRQALTEFADLHVVALASANPVEVVSSDKHTVKPWFQGRIPFAFDLPELGGSPFSLMGGRVVYFRQEPGAHLIFSYQRHLISTFVLRDTAQLALPTPAMSDRSSSFNLRSWTQNGLRYVVIGDVNPGAIQQLSELLQHAH